MQNEESINQNTALSENIQIKIREELRKQSQRYQRMMRILETDAPIEVLCLDKKIEDLLRIHCFFRIYEILDVNLSEVEFLTDRDVRHIAARLNQFTSMF